MKKIAAVLLTLAMAGNLWACGSSGQATAKTDAPAGESKAAGSEVAGAEASQADTGTTSDTGSSLPDKPVEIQLWTDFNIDEEVLQAAIDKFEEAYKDPGYTIVLDKFPGSDRAMKLSLAKEAKTLPALFWSAWFTTADEVHQGNIACIDDLVAPVKDDLYPSVYIDTSIDGKSYMVGMYQSYFGLLYNADYFKAAGLEEFVPADELEIAQWTLADLEEKILPALAAEFAGTEKYPFGLFAASNQADTHMMNLLSMYGGKMWTDGRSTAGSDEKVVKALETMKSWTEKGYTNSDVGTKDGTGMMPDFQNQLSAISFGQYTNYTNTTGKIASGEITAFDVRLASIPVHDNGQDSNIMADYIYGASVMNNGKEDEVAVAKEFLRWLLSDTESLTAINTNGMPCFQSITDATKDATPIYASYEKMSDKLWDFTGRIPGYVETRKDLFPAIQSVYSGEKTAEQALVEYQDKANQVIDEYKENSLILN